MITQVKFYIMKVLFLGGRGMGGRKGEQDVIYLPGKYLELYF